MPLVYLETSALVKRYVPEKGSDVLDALFDGLQINEILVTSQLTVVEVKSSLARLVRGKILNQAERNRLLLAFLSDRQRMSFFPVDAPFLEEVAALLDRYPLRTGDAIHFSSILRLRDAAREDGLSTIVVVSDNELVSACQAEGITAINPDDDGALGQLRQLRSS